MSRLKTSGELFCLPISKGKGEGTMYVSKESTTVSPKYNSLASYNYIIQLQTLLFFLEQDTGVYCSKWPRVSFGPYNNKIMETRMHQTSKKMRKGLRRPLVFATPEELHIVARLGKLENLICLLFAGSTYCLNQVGSTERNRTTSILKRFIFKPGQCNEVILKYATILSSHR